MAPLLSADFDVDEVLPKIPLPAKIKLLTGLGWWHTEPVPEVGIPSMRMSDGPNGARGTRFFNGVPASCFPSSTGLGSSFDVDLAYKVGVALGDECRAKGTHILLGPTINTQRSPLGGRGFESFSEDPHLNGTIAAAYINGLQSTKVAATIKHYVCNDQEFQRFSISSEVSERALREIYLKPFQIALKNSDPWALMSSYNRINGLHVSEDKRLLNDVLREEWGYKGLVMSDWIGVYSTAESILAGLDLEMPGPSVMRGQAVQRSLFAGKLFQSDIDARVRKILELLKRAYASGIPFDGPEEFIDTPEVRQILRTAAADAIVLLKNEKNLLPLKQDLKKIAVIGPNANVAMTSGGGSARLRTSYEVTPLEGITEAAKKFGGEIKFALGASTYRYLPLIDPFIKPNALVEFWNEPPSDDFMSLQPDFTNLKPADFGTPTESSYCFLMDGIPETINEKCYIKYSTTFVPDQDGDWKFGLNLAGAGNLFIDGKLIVDLSTNPEQGESFFGLGTVDVYNVVKELKAGQSYSLEIRCSNATFVTRGSPFTCWGGIRLGAQRLFDQDEEIRSASALAKDSDVAILVVGLNHDWESEGFDRENMDLPGLTNRLVSEVLKANPNTIIVNQSGTPVAMPWIADAHTLVHAFYGGNELGNGLADVLFGNVNPSGKLSLTFPKRLADSPSYPSFGHQGQEPGKILYNEGIFVGYRGFEIKDLEPLFPFGYGKSYSSFEYSDLQVSPISDEGKFSVTFKIKNTSSVDGREIAQVYIGDPDSTLPRPIKELKGFKKAAVKAGETVIVNLDLDREALGYWSTTQWLAEKGTYWVLVGPSSAKIALKGETELKKDITWLGL